MKSIYSDAAVYKLLTPLDETEHSHFCELAGDAASVLELASGCGALAARLARRAQVVGVDASAEMVALSAQTYADVPRVSFVHADMRALRLDRQFDLVLAVDNALQHACTDEALHETLAAVKAHLGPHSRALFQAGLRSCESIATLSHDRQLVGRAKDPDTGAVYEIHATSVFDAATQVNRRVFEIHRDGAIVSERSLTMRILDASALQAAFARSGLKVERTLDIQARTGQDGSADSFGPSHAMRTYECRLA